MRPVRAEDRDLFRAGFEPLSDESRYRRFLSPMPTLSEAMLRYLTEIDHRDHEALIAIDPESRDGIGVARYVRAEDPAARLDPAIRSLLRLCADRGSSVEPAGTLAGEPGY